jgi:hypothetical protein
MNLWPGLSSNRAVLGHCWTTLVAVRIYLRRSILVHFHNRHLPIGQSSQLADMFIDILGCGKAACSVYVQNCRCRKRYVMLLFLLVRTVKTRQLSAYFSGAIGIDMLRRWMATIRFSSKSKSPTDLRGGRFVAVYRKWKRGVYIESPYRRALW